MTDPRREKGPDQDGFAGKNGKRPGAAACPEADSPFQKSKPLPVIPMFP